MPGGTVILAPVRDAPDAALNWPGSCGKTQLAVGLAESLWQSREVELLVWVVATSRASVLAGYVAATVAAMGTVPEGDAEAVAARFVGWLSETNREWLLVLDDLSDATDIADLWPAGPTGRVLVTTTNSAALPGDYRQSVRPIGAFSRREALSYLMGRLIADTDQRLGAIDLVEDLACEPLALAQAIAVI
ncbi:MAG TPA: tetratricopeptide repeat protein, partial [Streptosporangiaceae bacterium]|nr:tetratricopeptide repeat protein [Streptosporangiaceae bacterium]